MADFPTLPILLTVIALITWMISIVRRIFRLARYFQLEGYERKRYTAWLGRQLREQRYILAATAAIVLLILPSMNGYQMLPGQASSFESDRAWATIQAILNLSVAVGLLVFAPRDRQVKQPFKRTNRAMRLLITAFVCGLFLPGFYLLSILLDLRAGASFSTPDLLQVTLFGGTSGAIALALAAYTLPLANAIMWPVEEYYRRYFMRLAKARLKATGATVIAITGSYGKTSTKHYLQHFLSAKYRSMMTPKSFNTLMGISRVINSDLADQPPLDYFIAEADAYFVGENASICRLVEPEIGMVMSVGPMHLERLGSMENIITAQYEIIESLPTHGVGIFNGDDPAVRAMAERGYPNIRLLVTQHGVPGARLEALNVRTEADGLYFDLRDNESGQVQPMHAPLYGETNVTNILMAACAAIQLGVPMETIAYQARTLQPADHRLVRRVLPDNTVIIDDAYSANPVGTKSALEVLKLHRDSGRRIVISSGMFELGAMSDVENRKLGEHMAQAATDVILIGEKQAAPIRDGLQAQGFPTDRLRVVNSLDEAIAVYRGILQPGDTLLMLTDLPDTYAN